MREENSSSERGAYISLANKYRPQTFEGIVGQDSVSTTLKNAIKSGRIAHAYLFYGPRGCGKTTTARILAKALNCTGAGNNKPTDNPCGKCPQCLEIASSSDMDVLELDAASNTQVEKVREAIIDTVALASGRDRYKVFILDEVHMLSSSSFNALLKTIEEPPSHVVFILATTELHKVPLTISSRCQTFRFKPITEGEITSHLLDLADAENIELDEEAAAVIAKNAGGALRDALTVFDRAIAFSGGKVSKELVSQMLGILPQDLVKNCVESLINKDGARLHGVFEKVRDEGFDSLSLLKDVKNALGDIFYLSLNSGKEPYRGARDILRQTTPSHIAALTRKISKLADEVKFSDTPALAAEVGLFTIMQNSIDIDGLISRLEKLESGGVGGSEKKSLKPSDELLLEESSPAPKSFEEIKKEIFAPNAPAMPKSAEVLKQKKPSASEEQPSPAAKDNSSLKAGEAKEEASSLLEGTAYPIKEKTNANPIDFSSALEVWPSFKQELDKTYPFLYEAVTAAAVSFPKKDEWTLSFKERDSFLKDTLRGRMGDLEKTALKICGQKIKFNFNVLNKKEGEEQTSPRVVQALKAGEASLKVRRSDAAEFTAPADGEERGAAFISAQEPFADGDYSAYSQDKAGGRQSPKADEILDIFDGQIVNG